MKKDIVIVGGGEHAKVVADALSADPSSWRILGFIDPDPGAVITGVDRLGDDDALAGVATEYLALGVGRRPDRDIRPDVVERLQQDRVPWATVVHPSAVVSDHAEIGEGATVLAGAVIGPGAHIGPFALINSGAIVEHDVAVGTHASVGPGVSIGGGATIGNHAYVGLGASVRDHVDIGPGAVVAMGSVVVGSVAEGATVRGLPAREGGGSS